MNNKKRSNEEFPDAEHEDMLNNDDADLQSKIANYHEYVEIGYEPDAALEMAGLMKGKLKE